MQKGDGKRTPLKEAPLHLPGQSLESELTRLFDERILLYIVAPVIMTVIAVLEWVHALKPRSAHPWFHTIFALAVVVFSFVRIRTLIRRAAALSLGVKGEKAIGQLLETFRSDGYQVFHDIPCESGGKKFNIDHVIVGPQGTFTIETKTISKPMQGSVEVVFDGEKISVNGWTPERDPVVQAQAESKWLHDMLQSATGRSFWIQPVIVYPGWFVRETAQESRVWVLNPDRLRKKIQFQPQHLKPEDIALVADRVAMHVRSLELH